MAGKIILFTLFLFLLIAGNSAAGTLSFQQVIVNGTETECSFYISEKKNESAEPPPDIPSPAENGKVIISGTSDYQITIRCSRKESLEDVVRILQILTEKR